MEKHIVLALSSALLVFGMTGRATATDVYVDAVNGDAGNNGFSLGAAKLTITQGVALAKFIGGARVRIQSGTYDVALGEVFPIVLDHDDITIYGDETSQIDWPRVGGDVEDSGTTSLFRIDASSEDREDVSINGIYFLGEDTATKDAPSAIEVIVSSTYTLTRVGVRECVCERSEMNASGAAGRATIKVAIQNCVAVPFFIRDSVIWASERGGIEVALGPVGESGSQPDITIEDCTVLIEGEDDADFGVSCGGGTDFQGQFGLKMLGTTIDATGATPSYGIQTGLDIWLDASDGHSVQMLDGESAIKSCEIMGCKGDGIRIRTNEEEGSNANAALQADEVFLNRIHHNGGAGVHLVWDGENGYVAFRSKNCLYDHNLYGIWYDGFTETISGQNGVFVNDTIADNSGYGFRFDGTFNGSGTAPSPNLTNAIVWGNNGGSSQSGGTGDGVTWNPVTNGSMSYSDWQGLPNADCSSADANNNIDCDPDFVDAVNGDYHLESTSPCIETGNSFPIAGLPILDIDLTDRTQNGDGEGGSEVDMGVDEYSP